MKAIGAVVISRPDFDFASLVNGWKQLTCHDPLFKADTLPRRVDSGERLALAFKECGFQYDALGFIHYGLMVACPVDQLPGFLLPARKTTICLKYEGDSAIGFLSGTLAAFKEDVAAGIRADHMLWNDIRVALAGEGWELWRDIQTSKVIPC